MLYQRKTTGDVNAVKLDPSTGDITLSGVTVHAGNYLVVDDAGTVSEADAASFEADYEPAPEPVTEPVPDEEPALA